MCLGGTHSACYRNLGSHHRRDGIMIRRAIGPGLVLAGSFWMFSIFSISSTGHAQQPASAPRQAPATKADADRWMTELSNWGRWGKDDQLGALNLITAEKRRQAM